jgi:flagellar hook capping protein FlgD
LGGRRDWQRPVFAEISLVSCKHSLPRSRWSQQRSSSLDLENYDGSAKSVNFNPGVVMVAETWPWRKGVECPFTAPPCGGRLLSSQPTTKGVRMPRPSWPYASFIVLLAALSLPASAQLPPQATETAVLSGELNDGEEIPLPVYTNGDTASESESRWIVGISDLWLQTCPTRCYTEGRVVRVRTCTTIGRANYMIVATRPISSPTIPPLTHRMVAFDGIWAVDSDGNVYDAIFPTIGSQCDVGTLTSHLLGNMFGGAPPSPIVAVGNTQQTGRSVLLENGELYYWCAYNTPPPGYAVRAGNIFSAAGISAVGLSSPSVGNTMSPNRPNPFNPATEIPYRVGSAGQVLIRVFDAGGRLVRTIENVSRGPGQYVARWDGRTEAGAHAASGTYFARITYPDGSRSEGKLTIAR